MLYSLIFSSVTTLEDLQKSYMDYPARPEEENDAEEAENPSGFAWDLVHGVWSRRAEIDALIETYSQNWRIDRIGHIELTILRLAMFEIFFRKDVAPRIVISEALDLSTSFGELSAKKFINGILDAACKDTDKNPQKPRV